ncbi:centriole proteome protein [Pycnococcus provasolii]
MTTSTSTSTLASRSRVWQHPFVNVFKLAGVDTWRDCIREGDVSAIMDRVIGKKALLIQGNVPAANYVAIPRSSRTDSLGLTGRFIYLELQLDPRKYFVVHIDIVTKDKFTTRVSISNLFKKSSSGNNSSVRIPGRGSGVQLPFVVNSTRWTVLAVDLGAIVSPYTRAPYECIKAIQLCANMAVRNVFTSDEKYNLRTLPRDMCLSHAVDPTAHYDFAWLPAEPKDAHAAVPPPVPTPPGAGKQSRESALATAMYDDVANVGSGGSPARPATAPPSRRRDDAAPLPSPAAINKTRTVSRDSENRVKVVRHFGAETAFRKPIGAKVTSYEQVLQIPGEGGREQQVAAMTPRARKAPELLPDPIMELHAVVGFSGELSNALTWSPHAGPEKEMVFPCGNNVVANRSDGTGQRFFVGHSAPVIGIAFSNDGSLMATAQEGKASVIRVWDFATGDCLSILNAHAGGLCCVDVSPDARALLAVGFDGHGKQLIVVWDISGLRSGHRAEVVVKHATDYHVRRAKFSPFEEDRLMTCGRDSIRIYRLKNGQLRGCSVNLGEHRTSKASTHGLAPGLMKEELTQNIFTDLAYEAGYGLTELDERHVFVSTVSGSVFQCNYGRRQLECVYNLHHGAINSIVVNEGFVVTGSDDKFLRVWPVDFSDFFLEAEHESPVTSVSVSADGLQIAIGTESGSVGMLDIPTHQYTTLMRSHIDSVRDVAADPMRPEFCTVSADGSIRVWSLRTCEQLYEFDAPSESVHSVAYHPSEYVIACGFDGGVVRVFSIATTALIQELRQHRGAVEQVAFTPDGTLLLTFGSEGNLCVYDTTQSYLPIKYLSTNTAGRGAAMAVSNDGTLLAALGPNATSVLLFHLPALTPHSRIELASGGSASACHIDFSADGSEVLVSTSARTLERYSTSTGRCVGKLTSIHGTDCFAFAPDPAGQLVVTGGDDKWLKVWDMKTHAFQSFIGHTDGVTKVVVADEGRKAITITHSEAVYVWNLRGAEASVVLPDRSAAEVPTERGGSQSTGGMEPGAASPLRRSVDDGATTAVASAPAWDGEEENEERGSSSPEGSDLAYSTLGMQSLEMAVGYNGSTLGDNVVWHPGTGMYAYSSKNLVVVEDLASRSQMVLWRHVASVSCLALSTDARVLASASSATELDVGCAPIYLWSCDSGRCQASLEFHQGGVAALAFAPGNQVLCSLPRDAVDSTVVIWDLHTATIRALGKTASLMTHIAWRSPHEFATSGESTCLLWSLPVAGGQLSCMPLNVGADSPEEAEPTPKLVALTYGFATNELYVCDSDGSIWCHDCTMARPSRLCGCLPVGAGDITRIASRGNVLVLGTSDGALYRFHAGAGGTYYLHGATRVDGCVNALALSASGDEGVVGTSASTVWYADTVQETVVPLTAGFTHAVQSVSPGEGTSMLAIATRSGVSTWDANGWYRLLKFEVGPDSPAECTCAAMQPGGSACVGGFTDGSLHFFSTERGAVEGVSNVHSASVVAAVYSPEGGEVLSASIAGELAVTNATSHTAVPFLPELSDGDRLDALAVAARPHGSSMAAAAFSRKLEVFGTPWADSPGTAGAHVMTYRCPEAVRGSHPESAVASTSSGGAACCAFVASVAGGTSIVAYSAPVMAPGSIVLLDFRQRRAVHRLSVDIGPLYSISASRDGRRLAVSGGGGTVAVADRDDDYRFTALGRMPTLRDGSGVASLLFDATSSALIAASGTNLQVFRMRE